MFEKKRRNYFIRSDKWLFFHSFCLHGNEFLLGESRLRIIVIFGLNDCALSVSKSDMKRANILFLRLFSFGFFFFR